MSQSEFEDVPEDVSRFPTDPSVTGQLSTSKTSRNLANAAVKLFLERGYDATTVDDIARAVNVSRRTFHRYFANKDDLITFIFRTDAVRAIEEFKSRPVDEPVLVSLRFALRSALQPISADPAQARRNFSLVRKNRTLLGRWLEEERQNQQLFAVALAPRLGRLPTDLQVQLAAGAVSMAVVTATEVWSDQSSESDPGTFLDEALDLLSGSLFG